jgi:aldehyde dehydrogenase (NAD+)
MIGHHFIKSSSPPPATEKKFKSYVHSAIMSSQYKIETRLFIDGKFVDGHSNKKFTIYSPATEEPVADVAEADEVDVDEAVAAAKKAFPAWHKSPPHFKSALLKKLASLIRRDVEELGYLEAISMGR